MSDVTSGSEKFRAKLEERRAREAAAKATQEKAAEEAAKYADAAPEDPYERTEEQREMDRVIESIDILDAYNRWCGKSSPKVRKGQTEGIKVSCPVPTHPDKNPSAWINTDNQTWFCGGCQMGGDAHDIAAYHFGYPVPGYKDGAQFHKLREQMAQDFGFVITKLPGGTVEIIAPEPDPTPTGEKVVAAEEPDVPEGKELKGADVIEMYDDSDIVEIFNVSLDWKEIVPENSFLDIYMRQTTIDDVTEEFHFWNGLLALGFALGRDVSLFDMVPVYGNLFVCTIGRSGTGKSKARSHLDRLLSRALPHDWSDPNSKGVRKISAPGSAEVLIHNFQKPVSDPADPKKTLFHAPVRGMVDFNELSALVGRGNRMGNVLKPTLMQFYDMEDTIATSSMTTGLKEAHQPFASALTTTQPKSLRQLIDKADDASGFLNRWVFVAGPEKERVAVGGARVDIEPAVGPLQAVAGWAATFGSEQMLWTTDGLKRYTKFFEEKIEPDKRRSQSDILVRIDLLTKKLCLLLAANRGEKAVTDETVEDMISCYEYVKACYALTENSLGNGIGEEVAQAVLNQAKRFTDKDGRGATLNQIAKALWRRKYPHKLILDTCDNLVKLGFLEITTSKPGSVGRPSTRFKYVG